MRWCGVFFLCGSVLACGNATRSTDSTSSALTIGVPESNVTGSASGLPGAAQALTLEGLTLLGLDGRVIPRLAEKWAWERDGLRLLITLRPAVVFHDGTPLTASAAQRILSDAIRRPGNLAQYPSLADIATVRAEGDLTLAIDLLRPSAFLPEDLELPLELAPSIGTGAYRIERSSPEEIVLRSFDRYYLGAPAIQRVTIRQFQTLRTAWSSVLRGDIDMVTNVPPEAVEFVSNDSVQVVRYARRFQYLVAFNSRVTPFRSPLVRRAINVAVNRDDLINSILDGHGAAATGPIWPRFWAYDATAPAYSIDTALAASLLDQAGYSIPATRNGASQFAKRLTFTCLIPENFTLLERVGLNIQKQLYAVGIDMQFEVVPPREYGARLQEGRFEAVMLDMIEGPTIGRADVFWRSAKTFKGLNLFGYENSEAERLLKLLRTSANEAAIRSATARLQRVLLDDPPALFIAWNEGARAVRRDYEVVEEPGRDPLFTIARWRAHTEAGVR